MGKATMVPTESHFDSAKKLWLDLTYAPHPTPPEFQANFDAVYNAATDVDTLWQLGGAANDFLRAHPNSIKVPDELAPTLLKGARVDSRIIGLKLLTRCSNDIPAICNEICKVLECRDDYELWGGICELSNLLDRFSPPTPMPVRKLQSRLSPLGDSTDENIRASSERLKEHLNLYTSSD